jgi:hypothetical protein
MLGDVCNEIQAARPALGYDVQGRRRWEGPHLRGRVEPDAYAEITLVRSACSYDRRDSKVGRIHASLSRE